MALFGPTPTCLKRIQPYLKIAEDHDNKDVIIAYWCRLYALQTGLKISDKMADSSKFLVSIMDWLEKIKKDQCDNEAILNDVVAQAHVENYALKLFLWADNEDRQSNFNKNVVKAFYTAGLIYDVVSVFGELSDEVAHHKKYAKWKSTYIHNCLKNGIPPVPGPVAMEGEFESSSDETSFNFSYKPDGETLSSNNEPPYPTIGGIFGNPSFQPMPSGTESNHSSFPQVPAADTSSQSTPSSGLGHQPFVSSSNGSDVSLRPEDFHKAQKYCKWAGSALQYEDVPTAVQNLQKALLLLTTGTDE